MLTCVNIVLIAKHCCYICFVEKQSFRNILLLIAITVALILGSQIYRTVENYKVNKQRFINDVQLALDLSVEKYYAEKARSSFFVMQLSDNDSLSVTALSSINKATKYNNIDSLLNEAKRRNLDSDSSSGFVYAWSNVEFRDSSIHSDSLKHNVKMDSLLQLSENLRVIGLNRNQSSNGILQLSQKVMVSVSEDLLELGKMSSLLENEFERKSLELDYKLEHNALSASTAIGEVKEDFELFTLAKSTYLPAGESLKLSFDNESLLILKKGLVDIILSLAIVSIVIGALFYLYRVISYQKQIATIKDDLISNITHEFKTPIATISSAIEGIFLFNENDDKEKTKRYLAISSDQLQKLNLMVEKLLETAAIDSGEVQIEKVESNISDLTEKVVANHKLIEERKRIEFVFAEEPIFSKVDEFHMENVISNLLDNAIKYGGDNIKVILSQADECFTLKVIDDGGLIKKEDSSRIFEKLYRVPTGNQHDVKGFGIGLYYTKAIVEKHGGHIKLETKENYTCFTITI